MAGNGMQLQGGHTSPLYCNSFSFSRVTYGERYECRGCGGEIQYLNQSSFARCITVAARNVHLLLRRS